MTRGSCLKQPPSPKGQGRKDEAVEGGLMGTAMARCCYLWLLPFRNIRLLF